METEGLREAASILYSCWTDGKRLAALPDHLRPRSLDEAYAIQAQLENVSDAPLCGWKVAATSPAGQAHLGLRAPIYGRLFLNRIIPSGRTCQLGPSIMRCAEMEFAFRFGKAFFPGSGGISLEDLMACVDQLCPAIEIPDSRFDDFEHVGSEQLVADNACAHYVVIGEPASFDWRAMDLSACEITGQIGGRPPLTGYGRNVLGDPRNALLWLANELARSGFGIRAGQTVITGACVPPQPISPGELIVGDFGDFGEVEIAIV